MIRKHNQNTSFKSHINIYFFFTTIIYCITKNKNDEVKHIHSLGLWKETKYVTHFFSYSPLRPSCTVLLTAFLKRSAIVGSGSLVL